MTLDSNQAKVHRNFGSDSWLGNAKHVEQLIMWTTFFRRNLHRFAQTYLGLSLHPYQLILLFLMGISEMFVWIAARSCAKSFVIAIYACCKAILYPNCKIVWAYGLMGIHIEKEIKAGLEKCGGEANNIYYCQLKTDYSGGGGHTSATGHIEGAKYLTKFLKIKGLV